MNENSSKLEKRQTVRGAHGPHRHSQNLERNTIIKNKSINKNSSGIKEEKGLLILNEIEIDTTPMRIVDENDEEDNQVQNHKLNNRQGGLNMRYKIEREISLPQNFNDTSTPTPTPIINFASSNNISPNPRLTSNGLPRKSTKTNNKNLVTLTPTPVVQTQENRQEKVKEIFNDYDYKIDQRDNKVTFKSYEETKKLNFLNFRKNAIFKNLGIKRKQNEIIANEKKFQLSKNIKKKKEESKSELKEDDSDLIIIDNNNIAIKKDKKKNKLTKKQMIKKRKRLENYTKIKKAKKQMKKKLKNDANFLNVKSYLKNKINLAKYAGINDWRSMLDEQLRDYFQMRNINLNFLTKSLANIVEREPFIGIATEEEINTNLNKLESFDGTLYSDKVEHKFEHPLLSMSQSMLEKEKKIQDLKNELQKIRGKGNNIGDAKKIIEDALKGINNIDKVDLSAKKISFLETSGMEETKQEVPKLNHIEKLKVKQRMINFSMHLFENFDLKKILAFWKNKRKDESWKSRVEKLKLTNKKKVDPSKKPETENDGKAQQEKKKGKTDVNVKQNYTQPSQTIKSYIPFCNNIYNIQRNES